MTTTPQAALLSADEIDQILKGLDAVCRDYDGYEYGLPTHLLDHNAFPDEFHKSVAEKMRDVVRQAILAKLQATQEPVQAEPTLRDYADSLIKAGHDFWKACNREAGGGAVRWLSCDDGTLIVFTRGEYRDTIMENIGGYKAPEVFFEEDGITAAESKEPVQAGELPPLHHDGWPARFRCDSCDGNGEIGEPISMGHFQPPERQTCPDCGGRGWSDEGPAFNADHMRDYARAALAARKPLTDEPQATPTPCAVTVGAKVFEAGTPFYNVVDKCLTDLEQSRSLLSKAADVLDDTGNTVNANLLRDIDNFLSK